MTQKDPVGPVAEQEEKVHGLEKALETAFYDEEKVLSRLPTYVFPSQPSLQKQ